MATEHGELMHTVIDDLQARGFRDIQAHGLEDEDIPETDRYFQISSQRWFHPDIQARSGDRLFLYDVETGEDLTGPGLREKIEVLANAAAKANGQFYLVVPEALQDAAQRLLTEMKIEWGEVWGISGGRKT